MTTTAGVPQAESLRHGKTKKAAEKARKPFAVQYLEDLIFEIMLNTGQAAKSREVASLLDETVKLHPKYIRKVLQASDRFGQEDRRWNLALRTATQLTFEGSIEYTLRSYGKPMSLRAIQNEMAVIHRRSVEFFDTLLTETLNSRPKYWQAPDGMWCLREWMLDTSDSDPDRCFLRNFFLEAAEVRPVVDSLVGTRMSPDQPLPDLAIKFIRKAGEPIPNKVLSYAMWRLQEGDLNPVDLLQACRQDSRLLMLSGTAGASASAALRMAWGLQESVEGYFEELKRAAKRAEKEEDAGWAEEEEPEGPVVLTPTDLEEALKHLRRRKRPQPAAALVEALFEYSPGSRRSQESVDALVSALSLDSRFVRVGRQTWALPDMMPKHAEKVPEELLPASAKVSAGEPGAEAEADAELGDEGLEPVLVSWVHDPRYEDFGEESEIEISPDQQPTDELRYVLLYDHWKAGTLKVRVSDRRFYPSDSDLVCATFVDKEAHKHAAPSAAPEGRAEARRAYAVWLSYTSSLLYDMGEWYAARKLMPGAVFAVTQGTMPDEFLLSYTGETDSYATLDADRIKALTKLSKEAAKGSWSVFQIMQKVLSDHPEGMPFMRLWAQVNVVRRTRRRAVASNLASYHCFYQKPANSDNWVFDERKVTQGRKKTKRKFVRHGS